MVSYAMLLLGFCLVGYDSEVFIYLARYLRGRDKKTLFFPLVEEHIDTAKISMKIVTLGTLLVL